MTRTALIAGGGGALGSARARELRRRAWRVVAVGRDRARLAAELGDAADGIIEVELGDPEAVRARLDGTDADLLVYNAGKIDLVSFLDTTPETFEASWRVNALGAFACARAVVPSMLQRGSGAMVFVGATSSVRGGARTAAFASSKHALRGLAQSLAKELGPRGVHVAHVLLDGKLQGERTQKRFPGVDASRCIDPADVATTLCSIVEQRPSAWTYEIDLRPAGESWS